MTDEREYVYAIGHPEGFVKIGRSKDPQQRLNALQTSSPYDLWLVAQLPADDGSSLEAELHDSLEPKRVRGEWFELDYTDFDDLVDLMRMCRNGGTVRSLDDLDGYRERVEAAVL